MERSIARWTTTVAAAALMSMPAIALAQSPAPSQPPSQPPSSQQPTTQPPTTAEPSAQPAARSEVDQGAAKQHLTAARNTLSQMTQMPEAAQLTGDARTQVSELISNFNALITTTTDWPAAYAKVEANLVSLIGPKGATDEPAAPKPTGTEGAVGTSGTSTISPEIKAKLVEFRAHLEQFEQAAGGAPERSDNPEASPSSAASSAAPADPSQASTAQSSTISRDEAMQHVQAIESLLGIQSPAAASGTPGAAATSGSEAAGASPVTLDAAKVQQLRSHLAELKRILGQR